MKTKEQIEEKIEYLYKLYEKYPKHRDVLSMKFALDWVLSDKNYPLYTINDKCFMSKQVTPIEVKDGEVIEWPPITIDWGNIIGNESIEINGNTYTRLTLIDIDAPKWGGEEISEYLVKEDARSFCCG